MKKAIYQKNKGETGSSPASPGGCTTRGSGAARVQLPHEAGVRVSDLPRPKTISFFGISCRSPYNFLYDLPISRLYTCEKCGKKNFAISYDEEICPDCWAKMKHLQKHDYDFIKACQERREKEVEVLGKLIKLIAKEVKK